MPKSCKYIGEIPSHEKPALEEIKLMFKLPTASYVSSNSLNCLSRFLSIS